MSQKVWAVVVVVVIGCIAVVAVQQGFHGGQSADAESADPQQMVNSLCRSADVARTGNLDFANAIFFDEAHENLHAVAAAQMEVNRDGAGTLLQQKNVVEASFASSDPAVNGQVAGQIDALAETTAALVGVEGCK